MVSALSAQASAPSAKNTRIPACYHEGVRAFAALYLALHLLSPALESQEKPEELLARIRKNRLDAAAVFKVREVSLIREDIRLYFTEGVLALLEPMGPAGGPAQVRGGLFVGEGELLVLPSDAVEKRQVARFTGAPALNEKFSSAYLRFTDDTAQILAESLKAAPRLEPAVAAEFLEQWGSVAQNLNLMHDLRLLGDLLAHKPMGSFFAARVFGDKLGSFDMSLDFRAPEQIMVGQVNWKDGRRFMDLWCSMPARSVRDGKRQADWRDAESRAYRVAANIGADRNLEVETEVELEAVAGGERLLGFELSRFLKVNRVEAGGQPLTFFQNESREGTDVGRRSNDLVFVVMPEPLVPGRRYHLRFHYGGEVISDAGSGVWYVGARGIWYPHRGHRPADFDLTFRFPKRLSLVATGDPLEQREEGEWKISRWKTRTPIRVAGFNIGDYDSGKAKTADGTVVEVYANRTLETALQAQRPPALMVDPLALPPAMRQRRIATLTPPPPPPNPAAVAANMARSAAESLDFFTQMFGPLPFGRVAISPVPGNFGQGWPGLVYLSTMSYLVPFDSARLPLSQTTDIFFRTLLINHELAHQWFGHVVKVNSYRDEWIIEALASYSSLLWLEQQRNGLRQARVVLDRYRTELLNKVEDEPLDSIGPLALGFRLASSKTPAGGGVIMYNKGPWVIHMLRQLMRDPKTGSDAAFTKFLRALVVEFSQSPLTTAGFRSLAEKFVRPELNAEDGRTLEWFFDQWIYGTGIPELKVSGKVEAGPRAPASRTRTAAILGAALLENVDESWILPVPIYAQTARGEVFAGTAVAAASGAAEESKFTLPAPPNAQKVVVDPQQTLLVKK
jgi:hypothetical protein